MLRVEPLCFSWSLLKLESTLPITTDSIPGIFAPSRLHTFWESVSNCSSFRYFFAAEKQLTVEKGEIRLTSVQARLCQCFYLLSKSRLNHCWSLFGTTVHLVLAMGMHRKRRPEQKTDLIDDECRKRVFWCAYSLDKYLSSALGRPQSFHDEDTDQELPTCVNDLDLFSDRLIPSPSKAQSIMLAPIAHIKYVSYLLEEIQSKPLTQPDYFELSVASLRTCTASTLPLVSIASTWP